MHITQTRYRKETRKRVFKLLQQISARYMLSKTTKRSQSRSHVF